MSLHTDSDNSEIPALRQMKKSSTCSKHSISSSGFMINHYDSIDSVTISIVNSALKNDIGQALFSFKNASRSYLGNIEPRVPRQPHISELLTLSKEFTGPHKKLLLYNKLKSLKILKKSHESTQAKLQKNLEEIECINAEKAILSSNISEICSALSSKSNKRLQSLPQCNCIIS